MVLAAKFLPMQMAYLPAWIAYACITGTLATGMVRSPLQHAIVLI